MPNLNLENGMLELHKILKTNYTNNNEFKNELFSALREYTGNDNLGMLCNYIISDKKNCDDNVTLSKKIY